MATAGSYHSNQSTTDQKKKKNGASTLQFHIKPVGIIGQVGFHVCFQLLGAYENTSCS